MQTKPLLVIVGAGPAGLTAACEAQNLGFRTVVVEKDPEYVGGLARTARYKGHRFDIGGHRFFSKNAEITAWWKSRLPDDFISVRRQSRIYYRRKFFDYPLKPWNALSNLGILTSVRCIASYVWARIHPRRPEVSFEDWVSNRFGRRLFMIFFKTYTEKIWGIPTSTLSADWAAQRIRGLSLFRAGMNALYRPRRGRQGDVVKTLVESFDYPRLGPGEMWEKAAADFVAAGGEIRMGWRATKILHDAERITAIEVEDQNHRRETIPGDSFIISMPMRETAQAFVPPLPPAAVAAARQLKYRDFLIVALILEGEELFSDNWLYIHEPGVKVGRIQNFNNWSAALAGEPGVTCLGMEYFCFENDGLWNKSDTELLELGKSELERLGLAPGARVRDGTVVRMEKAYPVYDEYYRENVDSVRKAVGRFSNIQLVGRNGMHKYNNQDHSMLTALMAVRNLRGAHFDVWRVNSDAEYHEEVTAREAGVPLDSQRPG